MPVFSAFTYFGALAFSSKPPHGEAIYEALRDGMGDTYNTDFSGRQQARLYGQAVALADAQYQLDRAGNNTTPTKATEMLAKLEADYQIIPDAGSSLEQRRAVLSARWQVARGAKRQSVESALNSLLGSDFLAYETIGDGSAVTTPASPGTVGVFAAAGTAQKVFSLNAAISTIGMATTVPFTGLGDGGLPVAGEKYCVDPDPRRAIEQITLIAATPMTITAVFTKAHEAGTVATRPFPIWNSNQRYARIRVSVACAQDPVKRQRINELMARIARGVSQWCIAYSSGVFTSDDPVLGLPDCTVVS